MTVEVHEIGDPEHEGVPAEPAVASAHVAEPDALSTHLAVYVYPETPDHVTTSFPLTAGSGAALTVGADGGVHADVDTEGGVVHEEPQALVNRT